MISLSSTHTLAKEPVVFRGTSPSYERFGLFGSFNIVGGYEKPKSPAQPFTRSSRATCYVFRLSEPNTMGEVSNFCY